MKYETCGICGRQFPESELIGGHGIRHEIENLILKEHPDWDDFKLICKGDFDIYRNRYISSIIEEEKGSIRELEKAVIKSIGENEIIVENINRTQAESMTAGEAASGA